MEKMGIGGIGEFGKLGNSENLAISENYSNQGFLYKFIFDYKGFY
jgi:hypothetical protein